MEVTLRKKGLDPWSKIIKYQNCFDYISPYWTRSGNIYTGLTGEDEKRLEKLLGFEEGKLSKASPYWDTFCVKLGTKPMILHVNEGNGWDDLQYLFLSGHKRVATSIDDIKPGTDYVLINKEAEAEQNNRINRIKRDAIKEFDKLSMADMRKCLRLYGYKSDTMSEELIESKLFSTIEHDPASFFEKWVNNKNKNTEFIIAQAISKNVIRKNRNAYYYGTDVIGKSLADTVEYLDDPKNQDLKMTIIKETDIK